MEMGELIYLVSIFIALILIWSVPYVLGVLIATMIILIQFAMINYYVKTISANGT
jgi:hypothetical protein